MGFMYVASSREDAWIETGVDIAQYAAAAVASSREDAWIETSPSHKRVAFITSRPPARTRGLKLNIQHYTTAAAVASSREDAWIETQNR